jgi:hypothetical protein
MDWTLEGMGQVDLEDQCLEVEYSTIGKSVNFKPNEEFSCP